MAASKQYKDPAYYEKKLAAIMQRLNVSKYNWDYNRHGSWIEFYYKNSMYRFEHSVEKAKAHGINLSYGSDTFAQLVLALEDLARMVERGIYDLQVWVSGMKCLPPAAEIPKCFKDLGFEVVPQNVEEVKKQFRNAAKDCHPDHGGNEEDFVKLKNAYDDALRFFDTPTR